MGKVWKLSKSCDYPLLRLAWFHRIIGFQACNKQSVGSNLSQRSVLPNWKDRQGTKLHVWGLTGTIASHCSPCKSQSSNDQLVQLWSVEFPTGRVGMLKKDTHKAKSGFVETDCATCDTLQTQTVEGCKHIVLQSIFYSPSLSRSLYLSRKFPKVLSKLGSMRKIRGFSGTPIVLIGVMYRLNRTR